jgi:hypothetical protein
VQAARQMEDELHPVAEVSWEEEPPTEDDDIVADETGMPSVDSAAPRRGQASVVALPHTAGQPLDPVVRAPMEQRIGHDFTNVRVHGDTESAVAARELGARALTVGRDIYFESGGYDPATREGRRLLAHELVHVVQQTKPGPPRSDVMQCPSIAGVAITGALPGAQAAPRRKRATRSCDGLCAPSKAPLHDGCTRGGPAASGDWITGLVVERSKQRLTATWSGGRTDTWACSPSKSSKGHGQVPTPLVKDDRVGIKCDQCHTNAHGDGMGWFTGLASEGRRIGFHDSQKVGSGIESHGCIRVHCDTARTIQEHTSTGTTTIDVVA